MEDLELRKMQTILTSIGYNATALHKHMNINAYTNIVCVTCSRMTLGNQVGITDIIKSVIGQGFKHYRIAQMDFKCMKSFSLPLKTVDSRGTYCTCNRVFHKGRW